MDHVSRPPAVLPRVWELFAQADQARYRARGGLGIGLALVRRLVELHGGTATAESAGPGRGSRFVVSLPLASPPDVAPAPEPRAAAPVHRRVLVVDDDRDIARSLGQMLELMGHTVRVVTDAEAVVPQALAFAPEVVLLDIGLGRVTGVEVAGRIRAEPSLDRALLVALTGYGADEDRAHFLASGFDRHLVKPVDPEQLEEVLRADLRDPW